MARILITNIMGHFDKNNLLSQYQHGFRAKHTCESQSISLTQEAYDNLENGQQADIYLKWILVRHLIWNHLPIAVSDATTLRGSGSPYHSMLRPYSVASNRLMGVHSCNCTV